MTIEKAIEVLKSECYVFNPLNFDRTTLINTALDTVIETLEQEPIRKVGKWVVEDSGNYNGKYSTCYCSACKDYYTRDWREMKYCPNCGAKMESEE